MLKYYSPHTYYYGDSQSRDLENFDTDIMIGCDACKSVLYP